VGARVTSPVLVGRRDELRVLGGVLDRAAAGEFALAVIGGEAGIGKTRLSMLAGERARRQGFQVLIGGCLDIGESTVPYAPLLEALRQLWTELDSDALTEVLGRPAPNWDSRSAASERQVADRDRMPRDPLTLCDDHPAATSRACKRERHAKDANQPAGGPERQALCQKS